MTASKSSIKPPPRVRGFLTSEYVESLEEMQQSCFQGRLIREGCLFTNSNDKN